MSEMRLFCHYLKHFSGGFVLCLSTPGVGPIFPFPCALRDRNSGPLLPFLLNSSSVCSICAALAQDLLRQTGCILGVCLLRGERLQIEAIMTFLQA